MGKCKKDRLNEEKYNNQGCLMKIVEYNNAHNITVEFQDEHKIKIKTQYGQFLLGEVKNPYYPSVYEVGIIGTKYPVRRDNKSAKEYEAWKHMLCRCFDKNEKEKYLTYIDATCCEEWLNYENFYEWLHSQPNFDKWYNGKRWNIDKDILIKNNKIYSPETCCLVPSNVNSLFTKSNATRGKFPIGVTAHGKGYQAQCNNLLKGKQECIGSYSTPRGAFLAYKKYKEKLIKQVAQIEYDKGNITKTCYKAMMSYEVEITD